MGASQSSQDGDSLDQSNPHRITVVNPKPEQSGESEENRIVLPRRVPPIMGMERHIIDLSKHPKEFQLDRQVWADFVITIEKFSNSRADLVASRQSQLQEKILSTDEIVQRFTDSYVNDKHRALAKLNENCKKISDISANLDKCTIQSELCVDMLRKLNFLLPDGHKLEPLET